MIAREAMTPAPLTVTRRTSVAAALRLARDNGINPARRWSSGVRSWACGSGCSP